MAVEAVGVGVFWKKSRTFVELRGRRKWMVLSFMLDRREEHPRIRQVVGAGGRWSHFVRVDGPEEVDDELRSWLTASFVCAAD
jgi:hypothetical protein